MFKTNTFPIIFKLKNEKTTKEKITGLNKKERIFLEYDINWYHPVLYTGIQIKVIGFFSRSMTTLMKDLMQRVNRHAGICKQIMSRLSILIHWKLR